MIDKLLLSFIPLFVAFDVISILPIYIRLTMNHTEESKNRYLHDSLLTAFFTTLLFVVIGNRIMGYLGISMKDFFIAGGIVIFVTAIKETLTGHSDIVEEDNASGVVPFGVPLLSGPAVLATSLIIWNQFEFYYFLISLVVNIIICAVILRFSGLIMEVLGKQFITVLSKVLGLLIASFAIMFIRKGI